MQYLDNDMDDLFRKAAEEYPLHTPAPDWARLEKAMQANSDKPMPQGKNKNDYRNLFWLLVLLPLGFICNHNLRSGSEGFGKTNSNKATSFDNKIAAKQNSTPAVKPVSEKDMAAGLVAENETKTQGNNNILNNNVSNNKATTGSLNTRQNGHDAQTHSTNKMPLTIRPAKAETISYDDKKSNVTKARSNTRIQKSYVKRANSKSYDATPSNVLKDANILDETNQSLSDDQLTSTQAAPKTKVEKTNPEQKKITDSLPGSSASNEKKKKEKPLPQRGIYVGVMGALDVSTIKMQTVEHIGFGAGILVGYQFNKRWAIETGVMWDKKQYYTKGEYFDRSKIQNIPTYVDIIDMSGNCNMFEVPINARYNFSYHKKGNYFATAGLTSYFMKKENYVYWADAYGNYYTGHRSYSNSGSNWFSIMNLSAGYEHSLGKIGAVRVEPYLKIPLTGVGIGNLPISSIGLNVGFTHHFR